MNAIYHVKSGVDPVLVIGGGANPLDGGANQIYFMHFLKNPMKLKEILVCRGAHDGSTP